ncbi:MAG TPA: YezD family protein [Chthoniobacterales bacterium]
MNQPEWLALVRQKVETLRYGVVQIIVHDSRVTQIERTEKTKITEYREPQSLHPSETLRRPDILEES